MSKNINDYEGALFDGFLSTELKENIMIKTILNTIYLPLLIANRDSIVCFVNDGYIRANGEGSEKIVGKRLKENLLIHKVINDGRPILGSHKNMGKDEYIVYILPLVINDKIAGGVSIAIYADEVYKLYKELENYKKANESLEKIVFKAYEARYTFDSIIGDSNVMQKVLKFSRIVAKGQSYIV